MKLNQYTVEKFKLTEVKPNPDPNIILPNTTEAILELIYGDSHSQNISKSETSFDSKDKVNPSDLDADLQTESDLDYPIAINLERFIYNLGQRYKVWVNAKACESYTQLLSRIYELPEKKQFKLLNNITFNNFARKYFYNEISIKQAWEIFESIQ